MRELLVMFLILSSTGCATVRAVFSSLGQSYSKPSDKSTDEDCTITNYGGGQYHKNCN